MTKKKYTRTKSGGVFGYGTGKGRMFARKFSGTRKPDGAIEPLGRIAKTTLDQIRRKTYVRPSKITFAEWLTAK